MEQCLSQIERVAGQDNHDWARQRAEQRARRPANRWPPVQGTELLGFATHPPATAGGYDHAGGPDQRLFAPLIAAPLPTSPSPLFLAKINVPARVS